MIKACNALLNIGDAQIEQIYSYQLNVDSIWLEVNECSSRMRVCV